MLDMLAAIPGIFCAVPYGILADRIGRRPVLYLVVIGMTLSVLFQLVVMFWWHTLPLYLIFLGPIFAFVGGGDAVLLAMIYTIIADVSTEEARTIHFLWMGLGNLFSQLIGQTVVGSLMKVSSPWLVEVAGVIIVIFGSSVIFLLPETLHLRQQRNSIIATPTSNVGNIESATSPLKITSRIRSIWIKVKEASSILKSNSIMLLLLSFFPHYFVVAAEKFSAVYVSKRFNWRLSNTSYLLSLIAFVNILLLTIILPSISNLLASPTSRLPSCYRLTTPQKDLFLARISVLILTFGALVTAGPTIHFVITGLVIWTLGNGFTSLIRSVITTMVDQQHIARLYSLITVVDTLGAVAAGPVLPWLFRLGLKFKEDNGNDWWMGLPFLGTAGICGAVAISVLSVSLPNKSNSIGEEERTGVDCIETGV